MIQIVTGPQRGGKSTYINERAKPGDIIIDMDRIALALTTEGTEPFTYSDRVRKVAMKARAAAVTEALYQAQGERYQNVYIIHTDPTPDQRAYYRAMGGRIIECDPGKEVCLERMKSRPKQNHAIAERFIHEYYQHR
jgi:predicted kinase